MAWVATDANGQEVIFEFKPERAWNSFWVEYTGDYLYLPKAQSRNL